MLREGREEQKSTLPTLNTLFIFKESKNLLNCVELAISSLLFTWMGDTFEEEKMTNVYCIVRILLEAGINVHSNLTSDESPLEAGEDPGGQG